MRQLALALALTLSQGCTATKFITQAALGQLEMYGGVPLKEAINSPKTDARTRRFLKEVERVKVYGKEQGLDMHKNYQTFVQLDRPYVVWFVNASQPLAFIPITYTFPFVGSFPGLSWFHEADAKEFADDLKQDGWDVYTRGVTAFSTGGWFTDPIVSSMFSDHHPAALGFLINTVIHESVHATVLVPNQQYFNESLAAFVGNTAAQEYLLRYYGEDSEEFTEYVAAVKRGVEVTDVYGEAVKQLNLLYISTLSDEQKLEIKAKIMNGLRKRLELDFTPNNAMLIGFQLYHEGKPEFEALYATCQHSWPRFIRATHSLMPRHFDELQTANIGPTIERLVRSGCEPIPPPPWVPITKQSRRHAKRWSFHRPSKAPGH